MSSAFLCLVSLFVGLQQMTVLEPPKCFDRCTLAVLITHCFESDLHAVVVRRVAVGTHDPRRPALLRCELLRHHYLPSARTKTVTARVLPGRTVSAQTHTHMTHTWSFIMSTVRHSKGGVRQHERKTESYC